MLEHYTQGADGLMPALLTRFILLKDVAADAFSTHISTQKTVMDLIRDIYNEQY